MKSTATVIILAILGCGCGLFKRSDAGSPGTLQKLVNSALLTPPATNLGRDSSLALFARLSSLFPDAKIAQLGESIGPGITPNMSLPLLYSPDFDPLQASGDMLALDSAARPLTAVSQVTLGRIFAHLCRQTNLSIPYITQVPRQVWDITSDPGAVFSASDVLLPGESLPPKTAEPASQYWAFIVARNAFLYPYATTSNEVQSLASLYQSVYNLRVRIGDAGRATYAAQSAICESALNSPQFLLGTPGQLDVVRRVALELGNRRPTFGELAAIQGGGSLAAWVAKVQAEPGYLETVNRWHRDWLGLRKFTLGSDPRPMPAINNSNIEWPNSYFTSASSSHGLVGQPSYAFSFSIQPTGAATPTVLNNLWYPGGYGSPPDIENIWATNAWIGPLNVGYQDFDPRTAILVVENVTYGYVLPAKVVGAQLSATPAMAWIAKSIFETAGGLQAVNLSYPGLLKVGATPGAIDPTTNCWIPGSPQDPTHGVDPNLGAINFNHVIATALGNMPQYYLCSAPNPGVPASVDGLPPKDFTSTPALITAAQGLTAQGLPTTLPLNISQITSINTSKNNGGVVPFYLQPLNYGEANILSLPPYSVSNVTFERVRRYSPQILGSGAYQEQNGLSPVKLPMSQQTVYVFNTTQRFQVACALRIDPNSTSSFNPILSIGALNNDTWGGFSFNAGGAHMITNPYLLNLYRCGQPDGSKMTAKPFDNEQAYPRVIDPNAYFANSAPPIASFNTTINASTYETYGMDPFNPGSANFSIIMQTAGNELGAVARLEDQLHNEPYYLLDYIRRNHRPYKEFFNAPYTVGGPELEYFYRTQGYLLPTYLNQPVFNQLAQDISTTSPALYVKNMGPVHLNDSTGLRQIFFDTFDPIPMTMLSTANTVVPQSAPGISGYRTMIPSYDISQSILPKEQAGITTMPAFLSPVATGLKMRTVASRFFTRFFCGDPNIVTPDAAQAAVQLGSMVNAGNSNGNKVAMEHLNSSDPAKKSCYQCHINLDPLAAALSPNFLSFVEVNEPTAIVGEFFINEQTLDGNPGNAPAYLYAIRTGNERGHGAFLGKSVSGYREVANAMVGDARFYGCVVNTMFQNVFGRTPSFGDASLLKGATETLMNGQDFDAMIRQLVTSSIFEKAN